jgi:hypothetical protein
MKYISRQKWMLAVFLVGLTTATAQSALVTWNIDSSQSFLRLTIPDQDLVLGGQDLIIRLRDVGNNDAWTDAGGRASNIQGTLATNFSGSSISYLSGQHSVTAIESGSFRPNPAAWNSGLVNGENPDGQYSNNSGAPAAFAARVYAGALGGFLNFDAAFLAIRDVSYALSGSSNLSSSGGLQVADDPSNFLLGIESSSIDIDGLDLGFLGQPIPDIRDQSLGGLLGSSSANTLEIENLGGLDRKLTQLIEISVEFDVNGILVQGSASGQIVAFATIPEPSSASLLALATFVGMFRRRR